LQIRENANGLGVFSLDLADGGDAGAMFLGGAVAEIQPEHIGAGAE
jgi:hypothetical protein